MPTITLQHYMGHTSSKVTERYAHAAQSEKLKRAWILSGGLAGCAGEAQETQSRYPARNKGRQLPGSGDRAEAPRPVIIRTFPRRSV